MEVKETQFEYYDRELSWLSFNYRVLQEALDETIPIYDRIKFMAIYHSNLDEFYRVRVASYRSLLSLPDNNLEKLDYHPETTLQKINEEVITQEEIFESLFKDKILPELALNNIILVQGLKLDEKHHKFIKQFFFSEILSYLQPVLLTKGDVFSFLQDNVIYLAIKLLKKKKKENASARIFKYAIVKIPSKNKLPRFIELPKIGNNHYIIFLEDIIRLNLQTLFPGYEIDSSYSIKISRDAELQIEDEFKGNLADKIRKSLSKRKTGMPARFLYDKETPEDLLSLLKKALNLSKKDLVPSFKYQNIQDFLFFPNPLKPKLETEALPALHHPEFDKAPSILKAIRIKDYILHFPYQSYDYIIRFFNEAAIDPKVEEIKTTQYRLATNSAIVSSLISAALNGKKVTVFVEFKARFDEAANLQFADRMNKAGIHVIPSLPGLKVHAKAALVVRRSSSKTNKYKGYAYLGTGNFNEKTAQIYGDHGYFTCNDEIVEEVEKLFNYLANPHFPMDFRHFLVPKYNLRQEFKLMFEREIKNAKEGKKAYILMKMNSLEDKKIIDRLYEASMQGVKIDLIIRGICCLKPGKEYSKNIKVIRIVDRFLEHARIFNFYNSGKNDIFISSADLMKRNLNRRIEIVAPIHNEKIKKELLDILTIQLKDNAKARVLGESIDKWYTPNVNSKKYQAQIEIYNYLKNLNL